MWVNAKVHEKGREQYGSSGVAFAGLAALVVAIGIGRFAFTPIIPMMQDDASVSIVTAGWLASANYSGYLIGSLSMVLLRLRPAPTIRAGLVTITFSTLGMGFAETFPGWVILRAVAGVASAWVLINVSAWCLDRLAPSHSPLLTGTVFAGVGVGIVLAGAVCLALMYFELGSGTAWIVLGILALTLSASIWHLFDGEEAGPSHGHPRYLHDGPAWRAEWTRLVVSYGTFGFGYIIPATFLPVLAKQTAEDPAIFGWSWPILGIAAATSAILSTLVRATRRRRLWIAAHLTMAAGIVLPIVRSGIGPIILAALAVGETFMVITMIGMQEARAVAGLHAARLMAAMTAGFGLGQILGPIVVGQLGDGGNISLSFSIASVALVIGACALARSWGQAPT